MRRADWLRPSRRIPSSPSAPPLLQESRRRTFASGDALNLDVRLHPLPQVPAVVENGAAENGAVDRVETNVEAVEQELILLPPEPIEEAGRLPLERRPVLPEPADPDSRAIFTMEELLAGVTFAAIGMGGTQWFPPAVFSFCLGLLAITLIILAPFYQIPRFAWVASISLYVSAGFATAIRTIFVESG